jgi:hypothetical protein
MVGLEPTFPLLRGVFDLFKLHVRNLDCLCARPCRVRVSASKLGRYLKAAATALFGIPYENRTRFSRLKV